MNNKKEIFSLILIILISGAIFVAARNFMNKDDARDALIEIA